MKRAEQKAATRAMILDLAARRLREEGLAGNAVHRLMRDCGLTHGGFYVHFPSKDALDVAALEQAMAEHGSRDAALPPGLPTAERRKQRARRYLSRAHRDDSANGCPLAALLSEVAHAGSDLRETFQHLLAGIVTDTGDAEGPSPPSEELALAALAMGGLALARAVPDAALSDAILSACRDATATLADAYAAQKEV
ncbi:TetR/AcrR family transcriptional regulator [Sphingomonas ursincola]|uniref:TetR/AcrR family transcriptional regulator n=1 Tax=Sphingomonas ursincola TaxID=56361 RepID=A0A7V8RDC8_9SPHN|nr:TetR/AcrR family transcriptional regulator [Sphingomonas ursincola]MBA1374395.1 TetR/AcrR family transcriptional regulator [Sphingomonas ursincola]